MKKRERVGTQIDLSSEQFKKIWDELWNDPVARTLPPDLRRKVVELNLPHFMERVLWVGDLEGAVPLYQVREKK